MFNFEFFCFFIIQIILFCFIFAPVLILVYMIHYYFELCSGERLPGCYDNFKDAMSEFCNLLLHSSRPIRLVSERVVKEEVCVFRPSRFKDK